ncbi:hypothetical protein [Paracholeplasma manati]|uniref:Signal peptidase I n=1 Tax=Paracholeplasma manati TaxID=591373 RepID=A0ABT2Y6F3_9MOLU|nr:hypothetical protein [Paracholeplasma manati]MCV2232324.1 hypothetical protein [Paracholeplasma manati]MDG0888281.1 hypothetical protein [Paracholeplasma manati]
MSQSKSNILNVLKKVGNILFYTLIVFLLLFSISNLSVRSNKDIANVLGRGFLPVISDSMEGNNSDSFNKGSLVFVKLLSDEEKLDLEIGDIITFWDLNLVALNTHRIVYVTPSYVVTQGDKAAAISPYVIGGDNTGVQYEIVTYNNIKAIRTGDIGGVGSAVSYLQTPTGFAIFVIAPVVLLLAYQGYVLTKTLLAVNKEKIEAKHAVDKEQLLEAEKERIRKELLEELKKEESNK